ncbi:MAG: hypothetical protein ICV74_07540 [Thermoleophilia bacterium]|nr:hypothetical protein [Thermoleophilia bacterium]
MGRLSRWLLAAGVGALAAAATVDALLGHGTEREPEVGRPALPNPEAQAALVRSLRQAGVVGTLVWSDARCVVHVLRLPSLRRGPAPAERSCRFVSSPGGGFSSGPAVPDASGSLTARCRRGTTEVRTRYGLLVGRVSACGPAWRPGGALTAIRAGEIVEVEVVRGPPRLRTRLLFSAAKLDRLFRGDPWRFRTPRFRAVAWVDDGRMAAIVRDGGGQGDVLAVFRRGRLEGVTPAPYAGLADIRVSPNGTFVAARISRPRALVVVDRHGALLPTPIPGGRGIAWSRDELWTAILTADTTYVVETATRGSRFVALPIRARDVFWR